MQCAKLIFLLIGIYLDKHLILDKDTAEIKVRETMESSLDKKMLDKKKEKQVQTKGKAQARKAVEDAMSIAEQAKMIMKEEEKKSKTKTEEERKLEERKIYTDKNTELLNKLYQMLLDTKGKEDLNRSFYDLEYEIEKRLEDNKELFYFSREERKIRKMKLDKIKFLFEQIRFEGHSGSSALRTWNYRHTPSLLTFHGLKFNDEEKKYLKKYDIFD